MNWVLAVKSEQVQTTKSYVGKNTGIAPSARSDSKEGKRESFNGDNHDPIGFVVATLAREPW